MLSTASSFPSRAGTASRQRVDAIGNNVLVLRKTSTFWIDAAALYLASDESKHTAGSGFGVDGGMTAGTS